MINKLLFSLLLFSFHVVVFSQSTFTIHVINQEKDSLGYPEISIQNKLYRIGTNKGKLVFNKDLLEVGDTILVRYMGYEDEKVVIDNKSIVKESMVITLTEKPYLLEAVVVSGNVFNDEALFKKKKKNLLLPYFRAYQFNMDFEFLSGSQMLKKGNTTGLFKNGSVNIDTLGIDFSDIIDHKDQFIKCLKRACEINYLAANTFCQSKFRKNFYCDYKGVENNLDLWEFVIRPTDDMPWDLTREDEFKCLVYLNNNGIITRIDVQHTNSLESGVSYLLETNYILFNRQLVASETLMKFLPNAMNNDSPDFLVKINYSAYRKY